MCTYEFTGAEGCCAQPLLLDDFSDDLGWEYGATWERGAAVSSFGQQYGNPDPEQDHSSSDDNFLAGVQIGGNTSTDMHEFYYLTSPVVDAAGTANLYLAYWRMLNSDYTPYMSNIVEVWDGFGWVTLWQSGSSPGVQDMDWTYVEIDASPFANADFQVRFGYEIASGGVFSVASWSLDDVKVFEKSGPLCCNQPSDCQNEQFPNADCGGGICASVECVYNCDCIDDNSCTVDACTGGNCTHDMIEGCCNTPADCDDGNPCTADLCMEGECAYEDVPDCCLGDEECDDGNACTDDVCVFNVCSFPAIPGCCLDDAECDDFNPCTKDSCDNNECANSDIASCCLDSAECDDFDVCTEDACEDNKCVHSPAPECCNTDEDCNDDIDCTDDTCNQQLNTCTYSFNDPDCCFTAEECDDSDPCTEDGCTGNLCVNDPVPDCCQLPADCDDLDDCTEDECVQNVCTNTPIPDCT